jgi:hypothetical protein
MHLLRHSRVTCTSHFCHLWYEIFISVGRTNALRVPHISAPISMIDLRTSPPSNLATGKAGTLWQWFQEPDNLWRFHRFTAAMKSLRFPLSVYTESLDWKSLPPDSVVIDVGGGVGPVTYELYKAFPHLKYVVQDLPAVVKDAEKVASRRVLCMPLLIMVMCSSGLKSLQRLLKMGAYC